MGDHLVPESVIRLRQNMQSPTVVAEGITPSVAEGPLPVGEAGTCHDIVLAFDQNSTPLAECALCRQTLKVGAVCINVPAWICAGGAG